MNTTESTFKSQTMYQKFEVAQTIYPVPLLFQATVLVCVYIGSFVVKPVFRCVGKPALLCAAFVGCDPIAVQ